jgi:hypothetical protein
MLGEAAAERITTDRLWPVIVARIDTAAHTRHLRRGQGLRLGASTASVDVAP